MLVNGDQQARLGYIDRTKRDPSMHSQIDFGKRYPVSFGLGLWFRVKVRVSVRVISSKVLGACRVILGLLLGL